MGKFDLPMYDECRRWIQKKSEKKIDWDSISLACQKDDQELELFLERREREDDWPRLSAYAWKSLVEEVREYESKQESLIF